MKHIRIVFSFFLLFFSCSGQTVGQDRGDWLRIKVTDSLRQPVAYATVTAFRSARDSSLRVTDSLGQVSFQRKPGTAIRLRVEAQGYRTLERQIKSADTSRSINLVLAYAPQSLAGIVVTARRPLMRQEDDKTIVDPEPVANASTNAYEIMEKIPGVFTDADGNIYLGSTAPSKIYINGREQKMSNADVATLLKSLPPNAVEKIELMRTPSARFDASGGGGIVNIILKKNVRLGITGSVTAGMNQGVYGNRFVGFNISRSEGVMSSYLNLQGSVREGFDDIASTRQVSPDSILRQTARTFQPARSIFTGFGMNWSHPKWEYGFDSRISLSGSENSSRNPTVIEQISTSKIVSANANDVANQSRSVSFNQDLNLKYKIDSLGSDWQTLLTFGHNPGRNEQDIFTRFTLPLIFELDQNGDVSNTPYNFIFESNYTRKRPGKYTLEAGVKSTNVWFANDTRFERTVAGVAVPDKLRTSKYDYTENIHAAYVQGSKPFAGFLLKTGVRLENTNMEGRQRVPADTSFAIHRTDLFPYAYLSRKVASIAGFELRSYLVYRRTITRPSYDLFNPSIRVVDQYLYETGNPRLRPQFTQNYEINISAADQPIFALGRNYSKDIFSQVIYPSDSNRNVASRTYDNVGTNREDYFRMIGAIPPGRKYFFVVGGQYNFNAYDGTYEGKPLIFRRGSWTFFTYHQLKLGKTTQLSMNGFWRLRGQLQFYELDAFGQLNMNLTQQLLKKKLTLTLSVNDMFYTNRNTFFLQQGSVVATGERVADTRRFGLNLRYNFGIRKKQNEDMFKMDVPGL
jgi:hypothetical protein